MNETKNGAANRSPDNHILGLQTVRDQLLAYYRTVPGLLISNVLAAIATALLFTGFPPAIWTYFWIGAHVAVLGVRAWSARKFFIVAESGDATANEIRTWKIQAILGSGTTGILWGIGTLLFFEPGSTTNNALLMVLLGSINSVGALSLSHFQRAFMALLFASFPLLVVRLLLVGDLVSIILGLSTALYTFLLFWTGRVANRTYKEVFQQRTSHLDALESVSASETRLRSILDAMPVPLVIVGLDEPVVHYANRASFTEFGYSENDPVVGSQAEDYWVNPADRDEVERQLAEQGYAKDIETEFRKKNGRTFWGLIFSSLMEYEGKSAVLSAVSNISARKNIEMEVIRLLRFQESVIENANDCLAVFDTNLSVIIWNTVAEAVSGYTRQEIMAGGMTWLDLIIEDDIREDLKNGTKALVEDRIEVLENEVAIRRKDGSTRIIAWKARALRDEQGEIIGLISLGRDVTERITRERQLRDSHRKLQERTIELEELNRELDAFAHTVSHDLRAPVGHISGYGQMLMEQLDEGKIEDTKTTVSRIIEVASRMEVLISDLMLLSQVGKDELRIESVDLSMLVRESLAIWRDREPDRDVHLDIAPDIVVHADRSFITVAVDNMVNNAWKYTAKRERPEIQFSSKMIDGEDVLCLRDNGVGFDSERRGELFRPFSRLHGDDEFRGTGLGLVTVERIIHRHGGRIWAEGALGEGAAFHFTLPPRRSMGEKSAS